LGAAFGVVTGVTFGAGVVTFGVGVTVTFGVAFGVAFGTGVARGALGGGLGSTGWAGALMADGAVAAMRLKPQATMQAAVLNFSRRRFFIGERRDGEGLRRDNDVFISG